MAVARSAHPSRMLKKARLLTRPTLARRDVPYPKQGRLSACGHAQAGRERRGESYCVSYVEPLSEARTKLDGLFEHPAKCRSRFDRSHESIDRLFHDLALIDPHDGP
jgi:hypothetical protein